jgi:formylglycine-generating enzyme required for sulfatase activity
MTRASQFPTALTTLMARFHQADLDWDAENIADCLWLATHVKTVSAENIPSDDLSPVVTEPEALPTAPSPTETSQSSEQTFPEPVISDAPLPTPPDAPLTSPASPTSPRPSTLPLQTPTAPALRQTLGLGRALRPLMRKVNSYTRTELDETATAEQSAERRVCMTVVRPAQERWLEVALVVEDSAASFLWTETLRDFKQVLERQGAFRTITVWHLSASPQGGLQLFIRPPTDRTQKPRNPRELVDVAGRRLILFVSDCTSRLWQTGELQQDCLNLWATHGPLAIVQLLPGHLWKRTVLNAGLPVQLGALAPGIPNHRLLFQEPPIGAESEGSEGLKLPVITLEPASLSRWARMLAGYGESWATGIWFDPDWQVSLTLPTPSAHPLSAEQLVQRFMTTAASDLSKQLAGLMALVPVRLPIIYLIQATLLPESTPIQVAEVFMSGLVQRVDAPGTEPSDKTYDFVPGVRELLIETVPTPTAEAVLDRISQYIGERIGKNIYSFTALLRLEQPSGEGANAEFEQFATLTRQVLQRLGGNYAAFLETLDQTHYQPSQAVTEPGTTELTWADFPTIEPFDFVNAQLIDEAESEPEVTFPPPLQTEEFTVVTLQIQEDTRPTRSQQSIPDLETFEFTVATLQHRSTQQQYTGQKQQQTNDWKIQRQQHRASRFTERLAKAFSLEMVAIPGGTFLMGSPINEPERFENEGPQHRVNISDLFLSRYPITQVQWRFVAHLPQVNRELNPDPAYFKGENRPVEQVSWYDAVEFCDRLSYHTGRIYRLPSEAEWEYACRAGTVTPFHYGDNITTVLANYNGRPYANGRKGRAQHATTPVDHFGIANTFGLSEMHGNIFEWCQDHWHGSYNGAPANGSAWLTDNEAASRVVRGGSWGSGPGICRSAYRVRLSPDHRYNYFGFRVSTSTSMP